MRINILHVEKLVYYELLYKSKHFFLTFSIEENPRSLAQVCSLLILKLTCLNTYKRVSV